MTVHVVSAFDKHTCDFVILAVFSDEKVAEEYCEYCERNDSERFTDVKLHHPKKVDPGIIGRA